MSGWLIGLHIDPELRAFQDGFGIALVSGNAIGQFDNAGIAGFASLHQIVLQGGLKLTPGKGHVGH